jgi:hypothetical protein
VLKPFHVVTAVIFGRGRGLLDGVSSSMGFERSSTPWYLLLSACRYGRRILVHDEHFEGNESCKKEGEGEEGCKEDDRLYVLKLRR